MTQVVGTEPLTGEQARQLRKQRGWSQQRLAEEAGVSARMVRDFESGRRRPQSANLDALLRVLVPAVVDPSSTRARWPEEVELYLDVLGAYFSALPPEDLRPEVKAIFDGIAERRGRR